jgi:polyhydroxybutyrate depolymerase
MAYITASQMSDVVVAVAPVAGSAGMYVGDNTTMLAYEKPPRPVPVIVFHGTTDTIMPHQGGESFTGNRNDSVRMLSANESVRLWASYDDCDPTPDIKYRKGAIITSYTGGSNETEVVLYAVEGMGHGWPWGIKTSVGGEDAYFGVPATDIMWDFFKSHLRR